MTAGPLKKTFQLLGFVSLHAIPISESFCYPLGVNVHDVKDNDVVVLRGVSHVLQPAFLTHPSGHIFHGYNPCVY